MLCKDKVSFKVIIWNKEREREKITEIEGEKREWEKIDKRVEKRMRIK